MNLLLLLIFVVIILILASLSIKIVNQYERGVVFRLGKVIGVKEPGLRLIIPIVDRMVKVSLRIVTMPIPSQKIITQDNVSIDVAAVAYFKVVDPLKAVIGHRRLLWAVEPNYPDHSKECDRTICP